MNYTSLQCFAVLEQKPKKTVFFGYFSSVFGFFGCVNTDIGVGFGFSKNLGCRFRCRLTDPALVWYRLKAHHNGHNLSNETETLSRFF